MPARTAGQLRSWLSMRHSLRAEAVVALVLYGVYEAARVWGAEIRFHL